MPKTPDSPIKVSPSIHEGLVVSDGYNINIGDDDDELLIMSSKNKGKNSSNNKAKSVSSPGIQKASKKSGKAKAIQEEDGGEELNNMHVEPDTNDDYDCDYSQSISPT